MRIRKRFPSSSSLSSSQPLSDPQLNRSPVAVVPQHLRGGGGGGTQAHPDGNLICYEPSDPPNQPPPQPSDQHPTIGTARFRWVCSDSTKTREVKQKELEGEEAKEESWEEEEKSNDTRKGSIFGAEVGTGSGLLPPTPPTPPTTASSHQGSWCEGDYEVIPLKKRRGTFERRGDKDAIIIMEKGRKMKAKMNSKTNKKCVQPNADDDEQGQGEGMGIENNNVNNTGGGGGGGGGGVKKLKRGNMIMEGSRCSRVNGRGWRCCQQTLVGYSLCEHHLGKGRLRSVTSVRSRAVATIATTATASAPKKEDSSLVQEEQLGQRLLDDDNVDDEKKPLMITKKRMKLGTVKARSISSLLGQTSNSVVIAPDNNKNTGVL